MFAECWTRRDLRILRSRYFPFCAAPRYVGPVEIARILCLTLGRKQNAQVLRVAQDDSGSLTHRACRVAF